MYRSKTWLVIIVLGIAVGMGAEAPIGPAVGTKVPFESYSGYFVSNQFEPMVPESFLVITDKAQFSKVFGVAMVMHDRSHRLAKDTFKKNIVLAVIKRGKAYWSYRVESVTEDKGTVEIRYSATVKRDRSATFGCPMIVSIPKGDYQAVRFVENKKAVKTVEMEKKSEGEKPSPAKAEPPAK